MRLFYIAIASVLVMAGCRANTREKSNLDGLSSELRAVAEQQVVAFSSADPDDEYTTVHSQSPSYCPPGKRFRSGFAPKDQRTFRWRLASFRVVSADDPFVYARLKRHMSEVDKKTMQEKPLRTVDYLIAYRKEKDVWKQWAATTMGSEEHATDDAEQPTAQLQSEGAPSD